MSSAEIAAVPTISCLLPVYNGERYVAEAIDSILGQAFGGFELVIVDDGSTDGTGRILERYRASDLRIRVMSQGNGGIVSALNAGLALCRGRYVARMDADDIALPNRFGFQTRYLDDHPGCVLVGGVAVSENMDGSGRTRLAGRTHEHTDLRHFPPKVAVSLHPLIMVRRETLVAIGGYRDSFRHAEDYDLFIRLGRHGTIDNPPERVLIYRRHQDAVSIAHLELQERNAASAEIDNRMTAGFAPTAPWIFETYVRLRIWRRYQDVDPSKAARMLAGRMRDLVLARPSSWLSRDYMAIRLRILAGMWRMARLKLIGGARH